MPGGLSVLFYEGMRGVAFGPSFPFVFGLLGLHFLLYWPFRPLFLSISSFRSLCASILVFCDFIFLYFGLLGLHTFHFGVHYFILAILFSFGFLGPHFLCSV